MKDEAENIKTNNGDHLLSNFTMISTTYVCGLFAVKGYSIIVNKL